MCNQRLTVSYMVRHSRQYPEQAENLLQAWYRIRRDSAVSHARKRAQVVAASDAHLLETMQGFGSGAVPELPGTLAQSLEDAGRYRCGGKGVG
jgi:hypothetical protein